MVRPSRGSEEEDAPIAALRAIVITRPGLDLVTAVQMSSGLLAPTSRSGYRPKSLTVRAVVECKNRVHYPSCP
jgi:hypothetical protein